MACDDPRVGDDAGEREGCTDMGGVQSSYGECGVYGDGC
jgi:hypothetical protein